MGQVWTFFFKKAEDKKAEKKRSTMKVETVYSGLHGEVVVKHESDESTDEDYEPKVIETIGAYGTICSSLYHSIHDESTTIVDDEERMPSFISPVKVRALRT